MFAGNKCEMPREHHQVPKELVSNYVHYELPRLRAKVSRGRSLCNQLIVADSRLQVRHRLPVRDLVHSFVASAIVAIIVVTV